MNAPIADQRAKPAPRAEGSASQEAVLLVALNCFVEQGFHGTSMRDIAGRAGTSIAAIYYHFPSKAILLRAIMTRVTEDLLAVLDEARAAAKKDDPASLLAEMVRAYVRFHTMRRAEAFVGNSELRSLEAEDRDPVIALRDRVSGEFNAVIASGLKKGVFECEHPREAGLAVMTMCTAVANWYKPGGKATPEQIADRYAGLALAMLGAK